MIDGKKGDIKFEYHLNNPDLFARRASVDVIHVTSYDQDAVGGTPKNERLLSGIPLNNVYQCHIIIHVDKFMRLDKKNLRLIIHCRYKKKIKIKCYHSSLKCIKFISLEKKNH